MLSINYSIADVRNALHSVRDGSTIKAGANRRNCSALKLAVHELARLFFDTQPLNSISDGQSSQIAENIINAQCQHHGYACQFAFGNSLFSINQFFHGSRNFIICDLNTNEKLTVEIASFPVLRKRMLMLYLEQNSQDMVDLRSLNLSGMDLEDVNFTNAILGKENVKEIISGGGDLTHATLAEDEDLTELRIKEGSVSRSTARWLIHSGAKLNLKILEEFLLNNEINSTDGLHTEIAQITQNIINTKQHNGQYHCLITIGARTFTLHQTSNSTLTICDLATNEKEIIKNITFQEFKKRLLKQYIKEQSNLDNFLIDLRQFDLTGIDLDDLVFIDTILSRKNFDAIIDGGGNLAGAIFAKNEDVTDLRIAGIALDKTIAKSLIDAGADFKLVLASYLATKPCLGSHLHKAAMLKEYLVMARIAQKFPIDLSKFNLSDINLKDIDFTGAVLNQSNLEAIIAGDGNLSGATLKIGIKEIHLHYFDNAKIDKAMAIQLITAGANPRVVLMSYLATERSLNHVDIDINGIDLTSVDSWGIDLRNVDVVKAEFAYSPTFSVGYKQKLQTNFEHDFLAMLNVYSKAVASIILQSSSKDIANIDRNIADAIAKLTEPKNSAEVKFQTERAIQWQSTLENLKNGEKIKETFAKHHGVIRDGIRENKSHPNKIMSIIKSSTGNCGEMAAICKSMLDIYLAESLQLLGYHHATFETSIIVAAPPSEHVVVMMACSFLGFTKHFIIDPWTEDGVAWTYPKAMEYFANRTPDMFTQPDIEFIEDKSHYAFLDKRLNQPLIRGILEKSKAKEQLDLTIKNHRFEFVGIPG